MNLPIDYSSLHHTQRRVVREEYIRRQQGKCYHCGDHLGVEPSKEVTKLTVTKSLFPKSFFQWPVHLHHSHDTGLTIGAVHNYCNAVLWEYHHE